MPQSGRNKRKFPFTRWGLLGFRWSYQHVTRLCFSSSKTCDNGSFVALFHFMSNITFCPLAILGNVLGIWGHLCSITLNYIISLLLHLLWNLSFKNSVTLSCKILWEHTFTCSFLHASPHSLFKEPVMYSGYTGNPAFSHKVHFVPWYTDVQTRPARAQLLGFTQRTCCLYL